MNPPSLRAADLSAAPLDTFWLDLASGAAPHRGHLIRLAGVAEGYATQPTGSGYVRVAVARDEDGIILVTCRRFRAAAGTTSTRPTTVLSHQRQQADALCEPEATAGRSCAGTSARAVVAAPYRPPGRRRCPAPPECMAGGCAGPD